MIIAAGPLRRRWKKNIGCLILAPVALDCLSREGVLLNPENYLTGEATTL